MTPAAPTVAVAAVAQRIETFRQQSRVRAGSLILSLFGDAVLPRGGRLWIGSLIRLLEPLGINERLTRTAVFRLAKDGWLRIEPHGRRADYLLTPAGQRRFEEASRSIYASQPRAWDGRWRLLLLVGEIDAKTREPLRRALFWQGFGAIGPNCFVHPSADLVRRAWNLDALAQAYVDFEALYQAIAEALHPAEGAHAALGDEEAFLLRTLLIHDWRRLLLRDPGLPDVLLPPDWPGQRARRLTQSLYHELLAPSERHLDAHLHLADGTRLPVGGDLGERFRGR